MRSVKGDRKAPIVLLLICLLAGATSHAGERGAVTAIASPASQASAFVGFASGVVLYCTRLSGCTELPGTPLSAVTSLDTPPDGQSVRAWVGFEDGSIYFCTLTGGCLVQKQD